MVNESVFVELGLGNVIPIGSHAENLRSDGKDASCVLNQVLRGFPSNAVKELLSFAGFFNFRGNMKFTNMHLDERFDILICVRCIFRLFWGPRAYLFMSFTVIINVDFRTWTAYRFGQRPEPTDSDKDMADIYDLRSSNIRGHFEVMTID